MKLNFKQILIIFLVALLGGSIGTIASNEILEIKANKQKEIAEENKVTLPTAVYNDFNGTDITEVAAKAINTVVIIQSTIETQSFYGVYESTAAGSGVIISPDGLIVTNNHVIEGAKSVKVIDYEGNEYDATLIGTDSKSDIGVIKIETDHELKYSVFADSDNIVLGQKVIAIGNPLGEGICVTDGIISALAKEVEIDDYMMELLQTNAAINSGNSGGGLFDMNGNIIGVVNAKTFYSQSSTVAEGMGYAIPASRAQKIVEDLINYGYVKNRATLGVSIYTGSNSYFYQRVNGCIVQEVVEGGAAEKAGIKVGDNITNVDEYSVTSYSDLANVLDKYEVGDTVTITLIRDNRTKTVEATLTEATN